MATNTRTTIEVNGFAVREIRIRSGIDIAPCAEAAGISRPYLALIETGARVRVSPPVFEGLRSALTLGDRRAILADPHSEAVEPDERVSA